MKIAYAVSAGGSEKDLIENEMVLKSLQSFDAISGREFDLEKTIQSIYPNKIYTVLDPTLLADVSIWDDFIKEPIIKEKYILIYDMQGREDVKIFSEHLAKQLGANVIKFGNYIHKSAFGAGLIGDPSPDKFVNLFKYATAVITTSFHGTAFSLIFKKDFYFLSKNLSGENRVKQLLSSLYLEDRIIMDTNTKFSHIDWQSSNYDENLKSLRQKSIDFLVDSLTIKS